MECVTDKLLVRFGDTFGTMVVRIWNTPKPKATVFCVHGFEGNGGDFDYLAQFLAKSGLTVVCPDMVGRGASTYFGDPAMYSIASYFTCLGALSKYAGEQNHFIGTSWGGAVCLLFLYRMRIKAEKLVLNDVGLRKNPGVYATIDRLADDVKQVFDTQEAAESYVRQSRGYLGEFPEDLWPNYLKHKIRYGEGKYRLTYDPAAVELTMELYESKYDLYPVLEKIEPQTLLLYGAESGCYEPAAIAGLMRRRPNISCIPNLKSGHPPSLMTYDQALTVSGFLLS